MRREYLLLFCAVFVAGCAQSPDYRLGRFTAISTFNVVDLTYEKSLAAGVVGEDCYEEGRKPNDARVERAIDDAIRNGQAREIEGSLLINVRIDQVRKYKPGFLGLPMPNNCIVVKGDLVRVM